MNSPKNGADQTKITSPHRLLLVAILAAVLQFAIPAGAQTVATNTQAGLTYALAQGGTVTFAEDGTIVLTNTLVIKTNVTLDASGYNIAVSGGNGVRIFRVNPGVTFTIKNLALINGYYMATNSTNLACGAAIYNFGTLNAANCYFSNNIVIGVGPANGGYDASGGAIYNEGGALAITGATFVTNCAFGGEANDPGGNSVSYAGNSYGGAIASIGGTLSLNGTAFSANLSVGGGMVPQFSVLTHLGNAFGGAVFATNAALNVLNTTFSANQVVALLSSNTPNNFPGSAFGGAICQLGGTLTLCKTMLVTNSSLGGGSSWYYGLGGTGSGAGLFNSGILNATNCSFLGNSATGGIYGNLAGDGDGGGVFNGGSAALVNCSIIGNLATGGNAGQSSFPDKSTLPGRGFGAGIYNSNLLVLIGSTIASNPALGGNAYPPYFSTTQTGGDAGGGGLYNSGVINATNNTLYGNSATGGVGTAAPGGTGEGGGFYNNGGTVLMAFQTIFGNTAAAGTNGGGGTPGASLGGGILAANGSVTLYNSIVASNASGGDFYVLSGALSDGGNNLSSDASFTFTAAGSHNNVNPLLGPLGNNGGPTQTMLPLLGSPAIDAASSASTTPFDQRGLSRPFGSASDIGAVEYYPGFTIQGTVQHPPPNLPVTVTVGVFSTTTDPSGNYTLSGVAAGSYSVTPSATGFVFIPASQSVNLAANTNGVNFAAYQMNALTVESFANPVMRIAFAGTNGQSAVVQSSATLSNWAPFLTNVVGANGIVEFQVTNTAGQPIQFYRAHSP